MTGIERVDKILEILSEERLDQIFGEEPEVVLDREIPIVCTICGGVAIDCACEPPAWSNVTPIPNQEWVEEIDVYADEEGPYIISRGFYPVDDLF